MASATTSGTTSYIYNVLGQRIEKSGPGGTVLFTYDEAGHLLGEYTGAGALVQETVWLGDLPVVTIRPGSPLQMYYVHADYLGTPRTATRSSDNAIVWRWDSDPFGVAPANANPNGLGIFVYNLRYPGQYYDGETGLSYNYFRDYDAQVGRYAESDPIGLTGGINTYAYANNNPVKEFDSRGLAPSIPSPIGVPGTCDRDDWKICEQRCSPNRVLKCYTSLVKKLKGFRNGNAIWVYKKVSTNCNCEEPFCKKYPGTCGLGLLALGIGLCLAPEAAPLLLAAP
jgi:RHS repeat-associated protein